MRTFRIGGLPAQWQPRCLAWRAMRAFAALLLMQIAVATATSALAGKVGREFRINAYTTGYQWFPSVAPLTGGGFVVAWESYGQDGDGWGVYAQRYDSAGRRTGRELRVNAYTASDQSGVSVTGLTGGGYVVIWKSYGQDGDSWGVYGQRFDSAGRRAGPIFRVNTATAKNQENPSVGAVSDGGFVVAWTAWDDDGYGVSGQRYDSGGKRIGMEFRVNTQTSGSQYIPSVAGLSDGGFVIIWESRPRNADHHDIYGRRYSSAGSAVGKEFRVNTYITSDQRSPAVAALNGGGFVAVWHSYWQDGGSYGVYAQRYDSTGRRAGREFRVNTTTADDQVAPSIAALKDGGFVVVWGNGNTDPSKACPGGICGQRYNATPRRVGGEFRVDSSPPYVPGDPSIAALTSGGFVVTWETNGQDGDAWGIFGQRFAR